MYDKRTHEFPLLQCLLPCLMQRLLTSAPSLATLLGGPPTRTISLHHYAFRVSIASSDTFSLSCLHRSVGDQLRGSALIVLDTRLFLENYSERLHQACRAGLQFSTVNYCGMLVFLYSIIAIPLRDLGGCGDSWMQIFK